MYNLISTASKLQRGSAGDIFFHNTVVKVGDGLRVPGGPEQHSRTLFRNNLCIGGQGGGMYGRYTSGAGLAIHAPKSDPPNDYDHDAVGTHGLRSAA
jgi:hypothetical protein